MAFYSQHRQDACATLEWIFIATAFCAENLKKDPIDNADTIVFLKTYHSRNLILEMLKNRGIVFSVLY